MRSGRIGECKFENVSDLPSGSFALASMERNTFDFRLVARTVKLTNACGGRISRDYTPPTKLVHVHLHSSELFLSSRLHYDIT